MRAAVALAVVACLTAACEPQQQAQRAIEQDLPAARIERARGDAQVIADAVQRYAAAFGTLPESLAVLTSERTKDGIVGGPFLVVVPAPPRGWSEYRYERVDDSTFFVSSAGDGTSVKVP